MNIVTWVSNLLRGGPLPPPSYYVMGGGWGDAINWFSGSPGPTLGEQHVAAHGLAVLPADYFADGISLR